MNRENWHTFSKKLVYFQPIFSSNDDSSHGGDFSQTMALHNTSSGALKPIKPCPSYTQTYTFLDIASSSKFVEREKDYATHSTVHWLTETSPFRIVDGKSHHRYQ
jgi:hypothetical protein